MDISKPDYTTVELEDIQALLDELEEDTMSEEPIRKLMKMIAWMDTGKQNFILDQASQKLTYYGKRDLKSLLKDAENNLTTSKTKKRGEKEILLPDITIKNGVIEFYGEMKGVEGTVKYKEVPFPFTITKRLWDFTKKRYLYYAIEKKTKKPMILQISHIRTILKDCGASHRDLENLLNYLALSPEIKDIKTIEYFGFYPLENTLKYPQKYLATNPMGHGLEFFEEFIQTKKNIEKGRDTWFDVVKVCENGVGMINALFLAAFSIASPFQKQLKKRHKIVPILHCIGDVDTAKTEAAKFIGNIVKYPIVHSGEELTAAVFSQLGSAGCFPLLIDEADKLRDEVENTIKVLATGEATRKRSNPDGTRRDAPEHLRPIITTANYISEYVRNSKAILDRSVFLMFIGAPTNLHEWKRVSKTFENTSLSLLNYLIYADLNYSKIIRESEKRVDTFENRFEKQLTNRQKGIFNYFVCGLMFMEAIGYFEYGDKEYDLTEIILEFRMKITETGKIANKRTIEELKGYIDHLRKNHRALVSARLGEVKEGYEAQYSSTLNRLQKQPMAIEIKQDGTPYILMTARDCKYIYNETDLEAFKSLAELNRTLQKSQIESNIKTSRAIDYTDSENDQAIHINKVELYSTVDGEELTEEKLEDLGYGSPPNENINSSKTLEDALNQIKEMHEYNDEKPLDKDNIRETLEAVYEFEDTVIEEAIEYIKEDQAKRGTVIIRVGGE